MHKLAQVGVLALVAGTGALAAAAGQDKVFPLPEVTSAYSVKAWSGRLFVSDARTRDILIYSLEDVRFRGRIGRPGEGPGEFDSAPKIIPLAAGLAVKSFSKLLFFSPEGAFQREAKGFGIDLMASTFPIFPVAGGYIGFPFVRDEDGRMTECQGRVYNEAWKPAGDIGGRFPSPTPPPPPPPGARRPGPKQDRLLIKDCADAQLQGETIWFGDSRQGIAIASYDGRGRRTGEIRVPHRPLKVPRAEKARLLAEWREEMKDALDAYNPILPDVYPAFLAFRVDGGEVHFVTPASKDGRFEILTVDLRGKILRRGFLFPLQPDWDYPAETNGRFDILDGRLYSVDYNDEAEMYELRITRIR